MWPARQRPRRARLRRASSQRAPVARGPVGSARRPAGPRWSRQATRPTRVGVGWGRHAKHDANLPCPARRGATQPNAETKASGGAHERDVRACSWAEPEPIRSSPTARASTSTAGGSSTAPTANTTSGPSAPPCPCVIPGSGRPPHANAHVKGRAARRWAGDALPSRIFSARRPAGARCVESDPVRLPDSADRSLARRRAANTQPPLPLPPRLVNLVINSLSSLRVLSANPRGRHRLSVWRCSGCWPFAYVGCLVGILCACAIVVLGPGPHPWSKTTTPHVANETYTNLSQIILGLPTCLRNWKNNDYEQHACALWRIATTAIKGNKATL